MSEINEGKVSSEETAPAAEVESEASPAEETTDTPSDDAPEATAEDSADAAASDDSGTDEAAAESAESEDEGAGTEAAVDGEEDQAPEAEAASDEAPEAEAPEDQAAAAKDDDGETTEAQATEEQPSEADAGETAAAASEGEAETETADEGEAEAAATDTGDAKADAADTSDTDTEAAAAGDGAEASGEEAAASGEETAEGDAEAEAKPPRSPDEPPEDPKFQMLWDHWKSGEPVQGKIFGWNQGGFHVLVDGALAFCPRSEMELDNPKSPKHYVEKTYPFHVVDYRPEGERFTVTRKNLLREEREGKAAQVRERLEAGNEFHGRVTSLTNFGAFVDLGGGIEGMVHVSEIAHKNVNHPKDELKTRQKVKVKVLKVEQDGKRISLSIKALEPNPWQKLADDQPRGSEFSGKVTNITDFGLFVEIQPGIEGLVHVSAIEPGKKLEDYEVGQELQGWFKEVEVKRQRISLSLRPVPTSDPWKDVEERYSEGSVVQGTVEEIAPFGVFINLEPGLTGLLPNSEMNLPRGTNPARVYTPGSEQKVQVGRIEAKRKRITLVPEGSQLEGSRSDYKEYVKKASSSGGGLGTLAAAFEKIQQDD